MLSAFDPRSLRSDTTARKRARRILFSSAIVGFVSYLSGVIIATLCENPLLAVASAIPFLGTLLCCISLFILLTPDPSENSDSAPPDRRRASAIEADQEKSDFSLAQQESPDDATVPCDPSSAAAQPPTASRDVDKPSVQLHNTQKEGPRRLTKRECDLLPYLAGPDSYRAIAGRFNVSTSTVKSHARSIFKKTGIDSREELRNRARTLRKAKAEQEKARPQNNERREQENLRKQSGSAPNSSAPPPRSA